MKRYPWPEAKRVRFMARAALYGSTEHFMNILARPYFVHMLNDDVGHVSVISLGEEPWDVCRIHVTEGILEKHGLKLEGPGLRGRAAGYFLGAAERLHRNTGIQVFDLGAWVGTWRVRWVKADPSLGPDGKPVRMYTTPACAHHEECLEDDEMGIACWASQGIE